MLENIVNGLLALPGDAWSQITLFFGSFYNPNKGVLENIFYNEMLWVGLGVYLFYKCQVNLLLLIFTLFFLWFIIHCMITFFGIELFSILFVLVIILTYGVLKRRISYKP